MTRSNRSVVYYHFTDYDLWKKVISKEGLIPQGIKDVEVADAMKRVGFNFCKGLWVWDRSNRKLVYDFFIHRVVTRGFTRGIYLKVKLKKHYLFSEVAKIACYKPDFKHDLEIGEVEHKDVPFDIYIRPVPPEDIKPIMEIGLEVKKCTKK